MLEAYAALLLGLFCVVIGLLGGRKRRRGSAIDPLPPELGQVARVAIHEVAEHRRVKIVGKLRLASRPLTAPLSGRPCAFFDARVTRKNASQSELIARETDGQDFFVEDSTGRALIRLASAQVIVKLDARYESRGGRVTSRQRALLSRHAKGAHEPLRYLEGALTPGETVMVVGTALREIDPDPRTGAAFREPPMRVVFEGAELYVTDEVKPRGGGAAA
jgi:hypothetical protein